MNITDFQIKYKEEEFEENDVSVQCSAGWYDWFCKTTSLKNKTKKLGKIIAKFKDNSTFKLDTSSIYFKNCYPINGNLYDLMGIKDENDKQIFAISFNALHIKQTFNKNIAVYNDSNDYKEPIFTCDNSTELVKFINT